MIENCDELIDVVTRHGYIWACPLDGESRQVGRVTKDGVAWVAKKVNWEEDGRSVAFSQECAKRHLAPSCSVLDDDVLLMEDLGDIVAADEVEHSPVKAKAVGAFFRNLHQLNLSLPLPPLEEGLRRQQEMWVDGSPSLPSHLRKKSRELLEELVSFPDNSTLHGDAHAWNLMFSADHVWLIDPAGVVGPPSFEVAYFAASIDNPLEVLASVQEGYGAPLPRLGRWLWWCLVYRYAVQAARGNVFRPEANGLNLYELLDRAEDIAC